MKRIGAATTILTASLAGSLWSAAPYQEDWESMAAHEAAPEWFQDAKLGIYFHWGVYCVPEDATEWYAYGMHRPGEHVYRHHHEHYGHPSEFGYHDFVPKFRGSNRFGPGVGGAAGPRLLDGFTEVGQPSLKRLSRSR